MIMRLDHIVGRFAKVILLPAVFVIGDDAAAIDQRSPEQIVAETSAQVLEALDRGKAHFEEDPAQVGVLIDEIVIPILDLTSMCKLILGRHWKEAHERQRASFIKEFKGMLIRTYAKSLVGYDHAKVRVLPSSGTQGSKYHTVQTELDIGSGKTPLQMAYVFRSNKEDEWKVLDLKVDGLSLAKNFRTSFDQEINETSLDALILRLSNANASGATGRLPEE